jgi:2,3-dihydroxybiphenyl 1,2-dioxygenase
MELKALGYLGIEVASLDAWSGFSTRILGLQRADATARTQAYRMDDRVQRLFVEQGGADGAVTMGWEVEDAAALSRFCQLLDRSAIRHQQGTRSLAAQRQVQDLVCLQDPAGNKLEIFHGAATASQPFLPGRTLSGFRTGALGLGHVVLSVADFSAMRAFYETLGFRSTDYISQPFPAYFFHINPRHHSLALIGTGRNAVHHLMMELASLDDVGQAYDLALREEGRVAVTLGRHANDLVTSFYAKTPSPLMVEYGWGGKLIDPATWQPSECLIGPDLWGHERNWLPPEQREKAFEMRVRAAAEGARAPVHVLAGQYQVSAEPGRLA